MKKSKEPRPSKKQREAFYYWYNDGDVRSYKEVAEYFGVSKYTVEAWAYKFAWNAKRQELDGELEAVRAEELRKRIGKQREFIMDLHEKAFQAYKTAMERGYIRRISHRDFVELVKSYALITGQATERHEIQAEHSGLVQLELFPASQADAQADSD